MASRGEGPDCCFLDREELDELELEPELPLNILDILLILSDFRVAINQQPQVDLLLQVRCDTKYQTGDFSNKFKRSS